MQSGWGQGDKFKRCLFLYMAKEEDRGQWQVWEENKTEAKAGRIVVSVLCKNCPFSQELAISMTEGKTRLKSLQWEPALLSGCRALLIPGWMQKEAFATLSDTIPTGWSHECPQLSLKSIGVKGVQHFPGSGHVSLKNNSPTLNIIKETNAH